MFSKAKYYDDQIMLITNKLCEVYVGPVRSPGASECVDINLEKIVSRNQFQASGRSYLIPLVKLHQHALTHHVVALVFSVLVDDAGNVHAILTEGQKRLLIFMCGKVHHEHVGPSHGACEHSTVRVQPFS